MIIAGASARGAAASALRAGFAPWCADLFADADLARVCPVRRVSGSEYPHRLPAVLAEAPAGPWLYTGALENHPRVVERVPRPLLGNPAAVLRRVRDPRLVRDVLSRHGACCPQLADREPDERRQWLVKPRRSAGGAQVRAWSPGTAWDARRCYLQERIDGDSYAALYVGRPGLGRPGLGRPGLGRPGLGRPGLAALAGVTRQLVGAPWLHAAPFHYCGSVGPVELSASASAALRRIGNALVQELGLRGLFGVDFILRGDEPWPVEVNPRYTASVEVLERATGRALLADHVSACAGAAPPRSRPAPGPDAGERAGGSAGPDRSAPWRGQIHGKAILFAPRTVVFPERGPWQAALEGDFSRLAVPLADVPHAGAVIEAGHPVLTVFAAAPSLPECVRELRRQAAAIGRNLK